MAALEELFANPKIAMGYGLLASRENPIGAAFGLLQQGQELRQNQEANAIRNKLIDRQMQVLEARESAGADMPSAVAEYQYYNELDDGSKQEYLRLKRAMPTMNLGGQQVVLDPRGGIAESYDVTPAPEAMPEFRFRQKQAEVEGGNLGTVTGEAKTLESTIPSLEATIADMKDLSEKADFSVTDRGLNYFNEQILGNEANEGSLAASTFESKLNNQVLPMLKPLLGGAFSAAEFDALRATLGIPSATPKQKQSALESFLSQTKRNLETKQREVGLASDSVVLRQHPIHGDITEDDIQATMQKHGVSREEVLQRIQ